jgi:hypothetical protein
MENLGSTRSTFKREMLRLLDLVNKRSPFEEIQTQSIILSNKLQEFIVNVGQFQGHLIMHKGLDPHEQINESDITQLERKNQNLRQILKIT